MKKLISIILLSFSLFSYCQKISNEKFFESTKKWVYTSYGNPIDGYKRASIKTNNNYENDGLFILSIENSADSIRLNDSQGVSGNDRDDLIIDLKSSTSLLELKYLLMYFDNDKNYYKVNYRVYSEKGLLWWNAVDNKDSKFLSRFDFVNKLKNKTNVTFRFVFSDDNSKEITFSLNGSKVAIEQTVDLSNFIFEEVGDWGIDAAIGAVKIKNILENEELNEDLKVANISTDKFIDNLLSYLAKNLGQFYSTFLGEIEYKNKYLYFYDFNDKVILEINVLKTFNE